MNHSLPRLTRRATLFAATLALPAFAAPAVSQGLTLPMSIAVGRVDASGLAGPHPDELAVWQTLMTRTGGLIQDIVPLGDWPLLGLSSPASDGGAAAVMSGRSDAIGLGCNHLLLYATRDGARTAKSREEAGRIERYFDKVRARLAQEGEATGEALLLGVEGGPPIASARSAAQPRSRLNLFDNGRRPEREALADLVDVLERRLVVLAADAYRSRRSIAG